MSRAARQGRAVATCHDALREAGAETFGDPGLKAAAKKRVDETRPPILDFALRERMEPQDAHPISERIGEIGDDKDVGRTGEDEVPGGPATVDCGLERGGYLRNPLHFVEPGFRANF